MADYLQSMTEGLDLFNTTAHSYRIIVLIICSNAITLPLSRRVYLVKLFVVRFFSLEKWYIMSQQYTLALYALLSSMYRWWNLLRQGMLNPPRQIQNVTYTTYNSINP